MLMLRGYNHILILHTIGQPCQHQCIFTMMQPLIIFIQLLQESGLKLHHLVTIWMLMVVLTYNRCIGKVIRFLIHIKEIKFISLIKLHNFILVQILLQIILILTTYMKDNKIMDFQKVKPINRRLIKTILCQILMIPHF